MDILPDQRTNMLQCDAEIAWVAGQFLVLTTGGRLEREN